MKILYLSCHEILEYDEVSLLTELGHDVFSMGAYSNPQVEGGLRPSIKDAKYHPKLQSVAIQCSKDDIHEDIYNWADIIIMMHNARTNIESPEQSWLANNWVLFKNKRTIWRSIGQSQEKIERELQKYKKEGLEIVRYSRKERNIPEYAGEDAVIRFYKDPDEWKGWIGDDKTVINFTQALKERGDHCGYKVFMQGTDGLNRKVYGPGNDDLGELNGGVLTYEEQKKRLRTARAYFYYGTAPASYTLSLIEAMMTGIPVVAAGKSFSDHLYKQDTNEIEDIIQSGMNGFIANSPEEVKDRVQELFDDDDHVQRISEGARRTAMQLWGKSTIMRKWGEFLDG